MTRLLRVELTRLRLRRAVVLLVLAAAVIPVLIFAGVAWNTRPVSDSDLRRAKQQAAQENARLQDDPFFQRELQRCLNRPRQFGLSAENAERRCPETLGFELSAEDFLFRPPLDVRGEREAGGLAVITVLVSIAMLIGTTFVGHDWNSGSMSNQLLFEPRRLRVYAAKAAAVFIVGLGTAAAVLAAYWGGLWLLTQTRDLAVADGVWRAVIGTAWRGAVLTAFAGVGGYALTMLFRSTVATLSIMAGTAIAGSLVTIAVLGEDGQRWLPWINALAWIFKGYELQIFDDANCGPTNDEFCEQLIRISQYDGALLLGGLLLVAVLLSVWTFRRRDVP